MNFPNAACVISVQDIWTEIAGNSVHRGTSFEVPQGKVVALIGGSGAGKSVMLRTILGLVKPKSGKISLFGSLIDQLSDQSLRQQRMRYGVLFQQGALFSGLSVAQNIAVPLLEQSNLPIEQISDIVALKLALTGLAQHDGLKMPSELSGGMRKRAALARALALDPELLFLDEPTSGLDPINARRFDYLIRTLCDALNLTVLLVTHDLDTIASIVDHIVVLEDGRVAAAGTYQEVCQTDNPWILEYFAARANSGNFTGNKSFSSGRLARYDKGVDGT